MVKKAIPSRVQPLKKPMEWISTAQLAADAVKLAAMLPHDTARIVGIPRSGMIAASIVATHLHLPLWELTHGHYRRIALGSRGASDRPGPTVVIDDTVYAGHSIKRARDQISGDKPLFACVYIRPDRTRHVDFYARTLDWHSHLLEWNFFNNHAIMYAGVAMDFDGVLCRDPDVPDADDGPLLEQYRQWLTRATPLYLPRAQPVRLIVTARLEKFRPETEAWLAQWGVRFQTLLMCPADRVSERGDIAVFKADAYKNSHTAFFVESDPTQAAKIALISRKQVICPIISKVWGAL